jgi:hypothetical protein
MSRLVKWNRSEEGYCESKCGRYLIKPLYCGQTTAQMYELRLNDGYARLATCKTQSECKGFAETHQAHCTKMF